MELRFPPHTDFKTRPQKNWIYKSIVILNQNEQNRLNALPQKPQKYIEHGALPGSQKSKNQKKIFLGSYFC